MGHILPLLVRQDRHNLMQRTLTALSSQVAGKIDAGAMNQIVVGIFEGQSSADAAVQDLEGARIPSVVIKRYAAADAEERITPTGFEGHPEGCPLVTVSVDDAHAEAVTGILKQHGSVPAR
jgi:hypothetical protein